MFIDAHGRHVTYLRISVTDRCDFRCVYCMGEDMQFLPRKQLLTLEEIARVGKIFADNGVYKFRFTGGEPLIRRDVEWLVNELGHYKGVTNIGITTNGSQLPRLAPALKSSGVTKLNISLDTLNAENFAAITRTGKLGMVLDGIDAGLAAGIDNIRLNAVIMRGKNEDQILPLVDYAREKGIHLAFIEEMPLGDVTYDRTKTYITSAEIRGIIDEKYPMHKALLKGNDENGPADYWIFKDDSQSKIGFISPQSCNFCADCNRVRLTAEGRLLLCLGHEDSIDLREMLRSGKSDSEIAQAIHDALQLKPERHEFSVSEKPIVFRHMNHTGG
ncbi:MAG: GTP 3',8-cyclase MoaA [Gammaproteobacteria bacterium]|nr:GTP 3',8-cyclase MoaA [Gammaproteobacteria bacterium]